MVVAVEVEHGQVTQVLMVVLVEEVEVVMDVTHVVDNIPLKVMIPKVVVEVVAETP